MTVLQQPSSSVRIKLIGYAKLETEYGIDFSRRHLARLEDEQKFSKRITLGDKTIRRVMSEIEDWLQARSAERGL